MGPADRQGSAYLKSALLAVISHFNGNAKTPFNELLREAREGFFEGLSGQLNFRQGAYSYQSRWKGALHWLRERLNEAPSEKVRSRARGTGFSGNLSRSAKEDACVQIRWRCV